MRESSGHLPDSKGIPSSFDSVVILSPYFWNFEDSMWQTTHYVAREFARRYPTVYVEPSVLWNLRLFRLRRFVRSIWGSRTKDVGEGLTIFCRRTLPFGRYGAVREFDLRRNTAALGTYLAQRGFRHTLLWSSFPYWTKALTEAIPHDAYVYHCLDRSLVAEEDELVREADAVFCVSETLVEKHRKLNPNVFLLPNGVDLKLFDLQRASSEPRPRDLPTDRPVLGFVGSLNNHVDFELVMRVAEAFPSCSVVLVGLVVKQYESGIGAGGTELFRRLGQMPNVRILGFKPTAEVPLYMAAFDVCLIPFRQNAFNEACDPLKFYQYSAMGKPIVTTSVKVAYRHRSLCYLAESHDDFITCISKALNERASDTLARQRMALAEAHAWPLIVARACRQLEELGNRSLAAPRGGTSGTQNARPEAAS